MSRFQLLLFDADNTLFDFSLSQELAFLQTLVALGIFIDDTKKQHQVYSLYRDHGDRLWKDYEDGAISREFLRSERFLILNRHFGLNLDPETTGQLYLKFLSQHGHLMEDALYVCRKLRDRGTIVGIVTNGADEVQRPRLAQSPLNAFINFIVTSEEAGQPKPHPIIFEMCLSRAQIDDKSKVCMVGDSLNADIRGGNRFGITTCWYNPRRLGPALETETTPHFIIHGMKELLGRV